MLQDARYALRSLRRAPGFTFVAVLTLALGIGGTTAIFSVVDGVLLRPLPYPEPHRIISVSRIATAPGGGAGAFSPADYLDYQRQARSLVSVAGYREQSVDWTGTGDPVSLTALETTAAFFDVFGVRALVGRAYSQRTDTPGGPRIAVLSEGLWQRHFAGAPDAVGSTIRLNGVATTVVGVMPSTFAHPLRVDLWMLAPHDVPTSPIEAESNPRAVREIQYFQAIARLAPGVTIAQATEELRGIGDRLAREYPETNQGESAIAEPLQRRLVNDVREALLLLMGAVAVVLLIACANVASLMLARGAGQRRELAVRQALGAGRGRLVRQLLTEALVLAALGGAAGILVAYWGVDGLIAMAPDRIASLADVRLDLRVALFAMAITAFVGALFGAAPALQSTRADVTGALKDGGRTGTRRTHARSVLVVTEVALSLMLLIGAGLMITSFARLRAVDHGFETDNLVLVGAPLPQARYNRDAQARFYMQLLERLQANPQTARSAMAFPAPFAAATAVSGYHAEGQPVIPRGERPIAHITSVSPGFFETMGIALLAGRDLSYPQRDAPGAVVINRLLAEREWPGQDPIGKRLVLGGPTDDPNAWLTVIGVVADSRRSGLQREPEPAVYLSLSQFTLPMMSVIVRSAAGEAAVSAAVRAAAASLDPALPRGEVDRVEDVLARSTGEPRFRALLVGAFAGTALLLAAVGIYGLISYSVAQRAPEIGVRLALGARPAQVGRLIVVQGLRLTAAGIAMGLAGAVAAARGLQGLLYSVSATDPVVYAGLALLLLGLAALACYLPARRAMRVDPMTALRAQ